MVSATNAGFNVLPLAQQAWEASEQVIAATQQAFAASQQAFAASQREVKLRDELNEVKHQLRDVVVREDRLGVRSVLGALLPCNAPTACAGTN